MIVGGLQEVDMFTYGERICHKQKVKTIINRTHCHRCSVEWLLQEDFSFVGVKWTYRDFIQNHIASQ